MEFSHLMENIAQAFEVVGVAIIAIGGVVALVLPVLGRKQRSAYFQ